jgi:Protein of unknown function (DUF3306)
VSDDLSARFSRWSQRKDAARRGAKVEDAATEAGEKQPVAGEQQESAAAGAQPVADEETPVLPPIDELTAESDYTVFFGKNVPEALTNAALRKLWRSDPVFAVLDGLNDYDEDFNVIDTALTSAQTSYKVGKGYIDDIEEELAKREPVSNGEAVGNERSESAAGADAADDEASGTSAGNSDAPGDETATAPRQSGTVELGDAQSGQAEDKNK